MDNAQAIREKILALTDEYYQTYFDQKTIFRPGDRINYAGRVFDQEELRELVSASLEFWLTGGHYTQEFETGLAAWLGVRYCSLVNSGSSANLLAFAALTSPVLGDQRIKPGDEVITVAAGFPTTVAPIVQYGTIPVLWISRFLNIMWIQPCCGRRFLTGQKRSCWLIRWGIRLI